MLQNVMKCNVYCTSAAHFAAVNAIYARYFAGRSAGTHLRLRAALWFAPFDIEIDCVAVASARSIQRRR